MARASYSDISSEMSDSEKSGMDTADVVKLFDSEDELNESFSGFEKEPTKQAETANNTDGKAKESRRGRVRGVEKGTGKGPGKNLKGKAPMKKRKSEPKSKKKHADSSIDPSLIVQLVSEYFKRKSDEFPSTSKSGTCEPEIDVNQQYEVSDYDFDSVSVPDMPERQLNIGDVFNNPSNMSEQFVIDNSEVQGFEMPKIFEDQIKFSEAVSDDSSKFVTSACTQKADVSSFVKEIQIPVNCKSLVPPLINPEIWSCLYTNIQQRDKSLQDVQKVLGMAIVPLVKLTEMLKTCRIDLSKAKQYVAQALALSCNTFFELNTKRRYFIRPYVNRRFQQLCSSACPIGEQLFPNDVGKRMKEINDASHIRQFRPQMSKNSRGRPSSRGQTSQWYQPRGRGYQRRPRGSFRGKFHT